MRYVVRLFISSSMKSSSRQKTYQSARDHNYFWENAKPTGAITPGSLMIKRLNTCVEMTDDGCPCLDFWACHLLLTLLKISQNIVLLYRSIYLHIQIPSSLSFGDLQHLVLLYG